ncbi:MAG: tyrosine-type recombinase/integrase [Streptosporangiales bacterium]
MVGPELADVLSAVICRIRGRDGAVPLVRARDQYELIWLPPSPLLFQRRVRTEHHAFTGSMVSTLLDEALARTGLTDPAGGGPLRYTAHDFRRVFITDAVLNGLPPHIAQVIAGHQDITVTMGYKAVYPQEAIEAHRAFIARRRAIRPSEEYRTPSDEEWDAFLAHFEKRKVSVGTCARAFGTPCIHEHACFSELGDLALIARFAFVTRALARPRFALDRLGPASSAQAVSDRSRARTAWR